ncbi:unnamed protein product [Nippostrongylus brasiliensis]|uniref:HTH_48 domain-containing protein n=1 Tax=Nippostrongylus brasiliensis TaxID=27835 RepID=A0A0N4XE38_NIPBR|nr:unnamed protein product [Nippostrongylus brasiliensis]
MAEMSLHIRHVLLYEFESGHSAAEAHRNLCKVFSPESSSERSVRFWFQRFKAGNWSWKIGLDQVSLRTEMCRRTNTISALRNTKVNSRRFLMSSSPHRLPAHFTRF